MKTIKLIIECLPLIVLLLACTNTPKTESGFWNNQQTQLLKFSKNNEYLVLVSTRKNDINIDSLDSYDSLVKVFVFRNVNKGNSNNLGWSLTSETKFFGAWKFENLFIIKSNFEALVFLQTNLGGAHSMDEVHLFKIDSTGKLEYPTEPYENDGTEHIALKMMNSNTILMERDQGTYEYSIVQNEIKRIFNSTIAKDENNGAIVAKYIFSDGKISALGTNTFSLQVGQSIIFESANEETRKIPLKGIFDSWSICEANRLRDFIYTFDYVGEFTFYVVSSIENTDSEINENVPPTFTVIVSHRK